MTHEEQLYTCWHCLDSKYQHRYCLGVGKFKGEKPTLTMSMHTERECARFKPHPPHLYVERCACYVPRQATEIPKPRHKGRSRTARRHSDPYAGTTVDAGGR